VGPTSDRLIKALVAEFGTAEGRKAARDDLKAKLAGNKPAEVKSKCIETLRQAAAVVDAKAPEDAATFKGWLRQISQHVAEAATEGGFFGIGGARVSDAEKPTPTEISRPHNLAEYPLIGNRWQAAQARIRLP